MKRMSKFALIIAVLAVSACTNANRFENDPVDMNGQSGGGLGIEQSGLGDPSSIQYFQQAVGDRVLFPVDQSNLTSEAQSILDAQANWLNTNGDYLVVIEGHADEQGTREYNLALGGRRANAVREYLVAKGVSASRIKFVSYGKERPLEICSDEACYSKNRRAVTVLTGSALG